MIRPLSLFILLATSPILFAQPLYKWVEDDGSITFSVEPPPKGVSFETVDSGNSESAITRPSETPATIAPESTAPEIAKSLPARTSATMTRSDYESPTEIPARTSSNSSKLLPRADASIAESGSNTQRVNQGIQTSSTSGAADAMSQKQQQCDDLQKRIVSLERRLRQSLSPEDMDNTVVYMAKYQRSIDQYCVQ